MTKSMKRISLFIIVTSLCFPIAGMTDEKENAVATLDGAVLERGSIHQADRSSADKAAKPGIHSLAVAGVSLVPIAGRCFDQNSRQQASDESEAARKVSEKTDRNAHHATPSRFHPA